jgi:hypothetical protein
MDLGHPEYGEADRGQAVQVQLSAGQLDCRVEETRP